MNVPLGDYRLNYVMKVMANSRPLSAGIFIHRLDSKWIITESIDYFREVKKIEGSEYDVLPAGKSFRLSILSAWVALCCFGFTSAAGAQEEIQFNIDVLDVNDRKNIDLSQFARSGYIMPGNLRYGGARQ